MAKWFRLFGETVEAGRGLIIATSILTLVGTAAIAWSVVGHWAALLSIPLLALSTPMFNNCRTVQAEVPSLAFSLLAFYAVIRGASVRPWFGVALGGVLFAVAALFKLLVAPMIAPLVFLCFLSPESLRSKAWQLESFHYSTIRSVLVRCLWLGAAGFITTALILFRYDSAAVYDQAVRFHLVAKTVSLSEQMDNGRILDNFILNNGGLVVLSMIGLLTLSTKNPLAGAWVCLWLVIDALFLLNHSPLFRQHLVFIAPPLAIAAAATVMWVADLIRRSPWGWWSVYCYLLPLVSLEFEPITGRIQASLSIDRGFATLSTSFVRREETVTKMIGERTRPGESIVTDQQMLAFRAGRLVPPELCDTSLVRIYSGYLNDNEAIHASKHAKMVIFWTRRLQKLDGFERWVEGNYDLLQEFGSKKVYLQKGATEGQ